jgi:hypothetical protein
MMLPPEPRNRKSREAGGNNGTKTSSWKALFFPLGEIHLVIENTASGLMPHYYTKI